MIRKCNGWKDRPDDGLTDRPAYQHSNVKDSGEEGEKKESTRGKKGKKKKAKEKGKKRRIKEQSMYF